MKRSLEGKIRTINQVIPKILHQSPWTNLSNRGGITKFLLVETLYENRFR